MSSKSEYQRYVLPNMRVLVGCAGFGGIFVGTVCLYFYKKLQKQFQDLPFHNRALTLLKSNSMAMEIIGRPIKLLGVEPGDKRNNYIDPYGNGRLRIPLEGRKLSGALYVWATAEKNVSNEDMKHSDWTVDRLEFKTTDKRTKESKTFIIYDKNTIQSHAPQIKLNLESENVSCFDK